MSPSQARWVALPAVLGLLLADVAAQPAPEAGVALRFGQLQGPAGSVDTEWQWPAAPPRAGILLQSGFARQCANLRGSAKVLAGQGWVTLCLQADMAGGAPEWAGALARALAGGAAGEGIVPAGEALPRRWVLAGHSAGAWFAARVAAALVQAAPDRLAGVILVDPVAAVESMDALLDAVVAHPLPVGAVLAPASRCNAHQQVRPVLERPQAAAKPMATPGQVRVAKLQAGTHLDLEGEDTEGLAVWLCGQGRPQPAHTEALRSLLGEWAAQMMLEPALVSR